MYDTRPQHLRARPSHKSALSGRHMHCSPKRSMTRHRHGCHEAGAKRVAASGTAHAYRACRDDGTGASIEVVAPVEPHKSRAGGAHGHLSRIGPAEPGGQ